MSQSATDAFVPALGCLVEPALGDLAARLTAVPGLGTGERDALCDATREQIHEAVHRRVARVLILELNAARVTGRLTGPDPQTRWAEFLDLASRTDFWQSLTTHYPPLLHRLRTLIANRCAASFDLGSRFAADRGSLATLLGQAPGELVEVSFGAGDSHRGGRSVAILTCTAGRVVYKPRSVAVDLALDGLIARLLGHAPAATRIRVPPVVARPDYGWAGYVTHRYCADDTELATFYRNVGHWVALMRLLGGSDLHAENLIACGPVPVVVDCETLFTPLLPPRPSGLGQAVDRATALVDSTALRTGILPGRGVALGWRGVDVSAGGALPGEQPTIVQPVITDAGTDRARLGAQPLEVALSGNHPSPRPALAAYWGQVLDGFDELTALLADHDRAGRLAPLLDSFAGCPIRVVPRATEAYAEISRMLWHPVSLHDPPAALARATRVLTTMAEFVPLAPGTAEVVAGEIADLLDGDVPYFTTTPRRGRLDGPRGTTWLPATDLIEAALRHWRTADLALDREVIRSALVSAYLNEGGLPSSAPTLRVRPRTAHLDRRRRRLAARIVTRVVSTAIRGPDGSATWIAPVLNETGWSVQPINPELYNGAAGVAILLAAYQRECDQGRADPVEGVVELRDAVVRTVGLAQDLRERRRAAGTPLRPPPSGGYVGQGSQIWTWLTLDAWGVAGNGLAEGDALRRAVVAAEQIVPEDGAPELLTGTAGAIVPLLWLAARTGDPRWSELAVALGDRVVGEAEIRDGQARWRTSRWPEGLGGFAHGATGIGWALRRLAYASGQDRFTAVADAAFRYEESLYDPADGSWRDLRNTGVTAEAWCHGAVGIGLAMADLADREGHPVGAPDLLSRAAAATRATGLGWGHSLCHGDLGAWELLAGCLGRGLGPPGLDRADLDAEMIGSLEEHGPVTGLARETFSPGLISGEGGIAYQLLRMHPEAALPSVLTLDGGPA